MSCWLQVHVTYKALGRSENLRMLRGASPTGLFINDTLQIFGEISSVAFFAPCDSKTIIELIFLHTFDLLKRSISLTHQTIDGIGKAIETVIILLESQLAL